MNCLGQNTYEILGLPSDLYISMDYIESKKLYGAIESMESVEAAQVILRALKVLSDF